MKMEGEANTSGCDSIILEIEGTELHCSRTDLTKNSDYFIAMFEGSFAEKDQNTISLKGVKVEAMKIILKFLHDGEFVMEEHNVLSVLQAACMLQFLQVKKICVEQVKNILRADNCISVWVVTEQLDLKELCYKAKLLSLLEFMFIKDSEEQYFLELSLDLILNYLGNVNLQCTKEFCVFEMLNTWYGNLKEKSIDTLTKLLYCVNYTALTLNEIDTIIDSQYISQFEPLRESLKCINALIHDDVLFKFKDEHLELAKKLLSAKDRNSTGLPCILIDTVTEASAYLYYDEYKRKRKYKVLEVSSSASYLVVYFDVASKTLKKLFGIGVTEKLKGFKMLGHKNYVFMFGGEFKIGQGNWNYDFHIYDVIKETWTKKKSPYPRRHFESCVCGNNVFIVGGTGPYRIIQENMFWYDLETEEFSALENLPPSTMQINCCQFQDKLFILDLNNETSYIFNSVKRTWTTLKILDLDKILPKYSKKVTVFSYKNNIFIKENSVYELKIINGNLVVITMVQLPQYTCSVSQIDSMLIADTVYSLSKEWNEATNEETISLKLFNVNTKECSKCFQKENCEDLEVVDEKLGFRSLPVSIFGVFHPNLVMKNDFINM